jgi:hypothetical protein
MALDYFFLYKLKAAVQSSQSSRAHVPSGRRLVFLFCQLDKIVEHLHILPPLLGRRIQTTISSPATPNRDALTTFTLRAAGADGAGENIPHGRFLPGQHAAGGGGRPGRCNLPQNRRLRHSKCIQSEKLSSRLSRSCSLRKRLLLGRSMFMIRQKAQAQRKLHSGSEGVAGCALSEK